MCHVFIPIDLQFPDIKFPDIKVQDISQKNMNAHKNKSLLSQYNEFELELPHPQPHIEGGQYIKSLIYGGLDGTVNTLAVILGGIGSGASPAQILAFGLSALIGDGLGMGLGEYLSTKAEKEFIEAEEKREHWQYEHKFDQEANEIIQIYQKKGYSESQSKKLVQLFSTNQKAFVNIMMLQQLGLTPIQNKPQMNGLVTLLSFCLFGLVPLLPYIVGLWMLGDGQSQYLVLCLAIAAVLFFGLGYAKAAIVRFNPWKSAIQTLVFGSIAIGLGYGVGFLFQ